MKTANCPAHHVKYVNQRHSPNSYPILNIKYINRSHLNPHVQEEIPSKIPNQNSLLALLP